jgi:hypothetical protein
VWYDGLGLTEGMTMSESSAETARLMNVVEAIVAELERQGVAQTLDDLSFDLMAMARAVIRAADGDVVPLFPNQRRPE